MAVTPERIRNNAANDWQFIVKDFQEIARSITKLVAKELGADSPEFAEFERSIKILTDDMHKAKKGIQSLSQKAVEEVYAISGSTTLQRAANEMLQGAVGAVFKHICEYADNFKLVAKKTGDDFDSAYLQHVQNQPASLRAVAVLQSGLMNLDRTLVQNKKAKRPDLCNAIKDGCMTGYLAWGSNPKTFS